MIPGARFVPLPGRNHIPFPQEPARAEFVRETRVFLGAAAAPAPEGSLQLTASQAEVLRHIAFGESDKQVAKVLGLSPRTVEMHAARALAALGCRTRAEAVRLATERRLLGT